VAERALPGLAAALLQDPEWWVRLAAVSNAPLEFLEPLLSDPEAKSVTPPRPDWPRPMQPDPKDTTMKENQAWSEYCKSLAPAIVEASAKVPVSGGPGALIKALGQALPDWKFRHAMAAAAGIGWEVSSRTMARESAITWNDGSRPTWTSVTATWRT
jgi:hypothetical protein